MTTRVRLRFVERDTGKPISDWVEYDAPDCDCDQLAGESCPECEVIE